MVNDLQLFGTLLESRQLLFFFCCSLNKHVALTAELEVALRRELRPP